MLVAFIRARVISRNILSLLTNFQMEETAVFVLCQPDVSLDVGSCKQACATELRVDSAHEIQGCCMTCAQCCSNLREYVQKLPSRTETSSTTGFARRCISRKVVAPLAPNGCHITQPPPACVTVRKVRALSVLESQVGPIPSENMYNKQQCSLYKPFELTSPNATCSIECL